MLLQRTPLAGALVACLFAVSATEGKAQSTPASIDAVELIPRDALFGNPERERVQISPDGKYLSWIAPVDGVINVWTAPANAPYQAKPVTRDSARGIRQYFWSYRPDTLLYMRDSGGDENFHLYALDVRTGQSRDLSDYPKT